jgi:hypothetical protein
MKLLIVVALLLDGLFALPAANPSDIGTISADPTPIVCPPGDPGEIVTDCTDPNPGGCWTYAEDGTTVIVLTVDECLAVGVDPLWTPDPAWTMPPGWAECWPGYWAICEVTP